MAFWIVILVGLVALGALLLYVLREQSLARERVEDELHDPHTPTLEYSVPTGRDPAGILAALERAGYTAGVDSHGSHQLVIVKCPEGSARARAQVRGLIESALVGAPGETPMRTETRFRDEA